MYFSPFLTNQIPPPGKGSLYIRPLLIGTGPILGLAPAPEYTFLIYVSPVGNYFKVIHRKNTSCFFFPFFLSTLLNCSIFVFVLFLFFWVQTGQLNPLRLLVEESYHRAAPGGTGGAKVICNYAPVKTSTFCI